MNWKKQPYPLDVQANQTVAYCTCQLSENPPHCDGAHNALGLSPMIEKFSEAQTVVFCGCGLSKNRPYCDGQHNTLRHSES